MVRMPLYEVVRRQVIRRMGTGKKSAAKRTQAVQTKRESTGIRKLRTEANRVLKEKSAAIANALGDKAGKGDIRYVNKLCKIASKPDSEREAERDAALMYSYAEQFANEPEYDESNVVGDAPDAEKTAVSPVGETGTQVEQNS